MSSAQEPSPPFQAVLESLNLDATARSQSVDATFIPTGRGAGEAKPDSLPQLVAEAEGATAELRLGTVLGEGGRGQVRLARQNSLRREVAVKSLKGARAAASTQELLREARITGGLEHPNVVPVYALGRGVGDEVLLVMKRVEGTPWGELLRREGPPRSDEAVERHLEIFRQVCNAVEFAHSKGVVHRDLKPDNVMVGAFGEVVVLDWGLALSLAGDPERGLPPASEVRGLAGTPSFMAPELVEGDGAKVGPWTDVYLLGAVLVDVFTGRPPHAGGPLPEVLERAWRSAPPTFGPEVPEELAAICRRALAKEPAHRFPSVAAFAEAVRAFARHRQSDRLAAEAQRRLDALPAASASAGAVQTRLTLAQCRFGFEQALAGWAESPLARRGLVQTLEREIHEEVAGGNLRGARELLAALPSPPTELVAAVDGLARRAEAEQQEAARLKALAHEMNPNLSSGARNLLFVIIGLVWFLVPAGAGLLEQRGTVFSATQMLWAVIPWALFALFATWKLREGLLLNRMGQRMALALLVAVLAAAVVRGLTVTMGADMHTSLVWELAAYGVIGAVGALVDLRFALGAATYTACAFVGARWPDQAFFVVAAANLLALVPMALLWDRLGDLCPLGWTVGSTPSVAATGDAASANR